MTLPEPRPGLVIRYSFLWSREADAGNTEGRKDRPCAIIIALPPNDFDEIRVAVVPITHSRPNRPDIAVEIPAKVRKDLDLDDGPAWACLDELNVFVWPGYDLRPIPGIERIDYGILPKALFERIRTGILALQRARRTKQVRRD